MADNVNLNPGTGGATIRTDELPGNVQVQGMKVLTGDDGIDGGWVTTTNGFPVTPASGSTWAISAASLPLPSGSATEAKQNTGNTSLASIDGKLPTSLVGGRLDANIGTWLGSASPTVGQKTASGSLPVVIASDQSTIPVSGTFWQATQPISAASLPLPSGASTAANQTTGNTSLSSIDTRLATTSIVYRTTDATGYDHHGTVPINATGSITYIRAQLSTTAVLPRYIQLFLGVSAPSGSAKPITFSEVAIPLGGVWEITFPVVGITRDAGFVIMPSTTQDSYTDPGAGTKELKSLVVGR